MFLPQPFNALVLIIAVITISIKDGFSNEGIIASKAVHFEELSSHNVTRDSAHALIEDFFVPLLDFCKENYKVAHLPQIIGKLHSIECLSIQQAVETRNADYPRSTRDVRTPDKIVGVFFHFGELVGIKA